MKRKRGEDDADGEGVVHKKQKIDDEAPEQLSEMEIREKKSLKYIQRQKGFENEKEILSKVAHESGKIFVEGEVEKVAGKLSIFDEDNPFSTPFNMKEERETGRFQENTGNFRWDRVGAGEDGMQKDFWADHLEDLEQGTYEERKKIREMSEKRAKENEEKEEREEKENKNESNLKKLKELVSFMSEDGEKVRDSIEKWKKKNNKEAYDKLLDLVTGLCTSGFFEIFSETKSSLTKKIDKFEKIKKKKK